MTSDKAYYYQRAEAELKLARQASDPTAVKAHYTLAGFYLDRVFGNGEPFRSEGLRVETPDEALLQGKADRLAKQLWDVGVIIFDPSQR